MKSYPEGGVTNYLGVHNSGEWSGGASLRDSASIYQALAGEKNSEGFLQFSTILEPPEVKSDAQNPSIIGAKLIGFEHRIWL